MGAPYIARAPKKVLVRIPRNEGYTTVPSGMATLRLIPSPLDKPQEAENAQTESRGASPLDRPPQFTTGVPTTYNRSLSHPGVLPSGNMAATGPVQLGRGGPGAGTSVQSEADRFVALQGRGVGGGGPRGRAGPAVYHNERSSSPAGQHHQHGGLAPSAVGAAGTTSATGPRATPLHYQGHFTAHGAAVAGGRCHQGVTHSATRQQQQQQPPPFTDFIAGQVWRALMMASQQQRQQQQQLQQQQQQQHHQHAQAASGGVRGPVVGGKRTRDVATASSLPATQDHDADAADEPSRKISRVNPGAAGAPVHGHHAQSGPQDAPPQHPLPQAAVIYTTPTVSHTGLHLSMPSPPSSPTTLPSSPQQQVYTTRFHTSIPTPPTTPPSIQHPCSPTLDDTAQLAHPESPKLLLGQPQQPLVPLSPPALSLPIMFPPVFPQSMNSTKSHPQQFPLSNSSSGSSSSGSVVGSGAVSGSGGRGCEGQGAPPHQQQASQLTAGVSPRPTHPLHRLSHHPLAALLQTTHGLLPVSAAHGVEGTAATAMSHPYLPAAAAATAPLTPMMRMGDRSGPEHHRGVRTRSPGLYRGLPLYTNSRNTNDKTSFNRSSISDTNSSSSRAHHHAHPPTTSAGASASSPVHNDTNTSLTSNCT